MKRTLVPLLAALLLAGCSRVTQENFLKIRDGMPEEVVWIGGGAVISVQFVNGKVALKSFDKPGARPK